MWVKAIALKPFALKTQSSRKAVELVKRISHEMTPYSPFPADIFRIDVHGHGYFLCAKCAIILHIMKQKLNPIRASKIAQEIKKARALRGLTLNELGGKCGVHHSQLSRMEQGKIVRISKNVAKICTFLQISTEPEAGDMPGQLIARVERLIASSNASARAIESMVAALEELTHA